MGASRHRIVWLAIFLAGLAACDGSPADNLPDLTYDEEAEDSLRPPPDYWARQLANRSTSLRREALGALGNYGRQASQYAPLVARFLSDPDQRTGYTAAWALAHIGTSAIPLLYERLDSPRAIERERAAYGVGELGPAGSDAVERLRALQKDPVSKVRDMATWALGEIETRQMVPDPNLVLLTGVQGDPAERIQAVERLGATVHTSRVAIRALISLMGDSLPAVREKAIDALSQAGVQAMPSLSIALSHRNKNIRRGAMLAISRMHRVF